MNNMDPQNIALETRWLLLFCQLHRFIHILQVIDARRKAPALRVSMEISLPTTANSNYSLLYLLATPKFIVKSVHIGIYLV